MARELKDYTVAELLAEINRREEVFTASAWMRVDVERAFDDAEVEHDGDTIDRFMKEFVDSFNERENEEGFERLNVYITQCWEG